MSAVTKTRPLGKQGRPKDDFYPTPPGAVRPLLIVEHLAGPLWECACGDGAIAKVLAAAGHQVIATDLNNHGFGQAGIDFLMERRLLAPTIITNPPYKLANAFVRHAHALGAASIIMLLPLTFLEGVQRSDIIEDMGLARVHVFRNRVTMYPGYHEGKKGNSPIAFAWFVWLRGHTTAPTIHRLTFEKEAV